jgi:small subunit ribosomal protein S20
MPNIKSAAKRMRQAEKRRQRNKMVRTELKHLRKKVLAAATAGQRQEAEQLFRRYCSRMDKAVKKGVVKKNTGSRSKSRLHHRMTVLLTQPAPASAPAPEVAPASTLTPESASGTAPNAAATG